MNQLETKSIETKDLYFLIKNIVAQLNVLQHEENAAALVEPLRDYVTPRIHVGREANSLSVHEKLEWYAGQLLSIVDRKSWWVMNSTLNLFDIVKEEAEKSVI